MFMKCKGFGSAIIHARPNRYEYATFLTHEEDALESIRNSAWCNDYNVQIIISGRS